MKRSIGLTLALLLLTVVLAGCGQEGEPTGGTTAGGGTTAPVTTAAPNGIALPEYVPGSLELMDDDEWKNSGIPFPHDRRWAYYFYPQSANS